MLWPMGSQRVRHNTVTELNMLKSANTVLGYLHLLGLIFNFCVCAFVKSGESKNNKTKICYPLKCLSNLFLAVLDLRCRTGFSRVAASGAPHLFQCAGSRSWLLFGSTGSQVLGLQWLQVPGFQAQARSIILAHRSVAPRHVGSSRIGG